MSKSALVTGAAKRIGREIALTLAGRGYDIALHYRASLPEARATADEIIALGRRCVLLDADLADREQVRRLLPRALEQLGGCSLLVNNASIFERGSFVESDEELFDRHFEINFRAAYFLSRDFARLCGSGQIINLLDANVTRDANPYFAYILSKKALAEFTRMAAVELAPKIRVNGICPGPMLPPPGMGPEQLDKLAHLVPLKRTGNAQLVAQTVGFLVDNEFITGEWIHVDGGRHLT